MLLYKDILKDDNPILRKKSINVETPLIQEDVELLKSLNEYLVNGYNEDFVQEYNIRPGVGLAAPQIGSLKRIFVIHATDQDGTKHHYGVINPKIISHSEEKVFLTSGEGCLSVDRNIDGLVHRYKRIKARLFLYNFENDTIEEKELKLENYLSVVFQHEYDHLAGTLFYDHINKENPFYIPNNSQPLNITSKDEE